MRMLLERRANTKKYTADWDAICRKIDHLIEEGKDPVMHSLRHRLIGAHAAKDQTEIQKISKQIQIRERQTSLTKRWLKKG